MPAVNMARCVLLCLLITIAGATVAVPTSQQLAWQDLEVGAMLGFNLQSHCLATSDTGRSEQPCVSFGAATGSDPSAMAQGAKRGWVPTLDAVTRWNPTELDTDAWAAAAASFGAKYIVLVVDHMSGFALWKTQQHNFSIASSRYKGGGGDVVSDLLQSCKKFDLKLGFFYSVHYNWWLGVHSYEVGHPRIDLSLPNLTQAQYLDTAKAQLTELVDHFGADGPAEIWFDGGTGVNTGPISDHLRAIAPDAVCHSCYPNFTTAGTVRWMGNEAAMMPLPSWAASAPDASTGDPHGVVFEPPSSDAVMREHYWFFANKSDGSAMGVTDTVDHLVREYLTSVGRASNLILNIAPDGRTGGITKNDTAGYKAMGDAVRCLFKDGLANTSDGLVMDSSNQISWKLPTVIKSQNVSIVLREDQTQGQLIANYSLWCSNSKAANADAALCEMGNLGTLPKWGSLPRYVIPAYQYEAGAIQTGIGHKRILLLAPSSPFDTLSLRVHSHFGIGDQQPKLRDISLFDWEKATSCY